MNSFAEALKRANIDVKVEEPKFIPYESVKDVKFRSCWKMICFTASIRNC